MSGKWNSSKTRVAPAFDVISRQGSYLAHFVKMLNDRIGDRHLRIPTRGVEWEKAQWFYDSPATGRKEIMRKAAISFLQYCVCHPMTMDERKLGKIKSFKTKKGRQLIFHDEHAQQEAVGHLDTVYRFGDEGMSLFAFEDKTQPDVCIRTNKFYLLVEGKRTERRLTKKTEWVKERDQLVRHIDAFLDNTDGEFGGALPVFGVEIISASAREQYDFTSYDDESNFDIWLPHRTKEMRQLVQKKFLLEHMTWEDLKEGFKGVAEIEYIDKLDRK